MSELQSSTGPGAPEGNKNAEKWNVETSLQMLGNLLAEAEKPEVLYIGQGLTNIGMYADWFSYMAEKFNDEPIVLRTIKQIEQAFESKLVNKALNNQVNAAVAIFTLKNKHDWKDKSETENRNYNLNAEVPLSREKMKAVRDNLDKEY